MTVWAPYCGPGPAPDEWLARWNPDPVLLVVLAAVLGLVLWRTSGRERAAGVAAVAVLALIFVSPLCALSSALFAARTAHHVLLVAVAAPRQGPGDQRLRRWCSGPGMRRRPMAGPCRTTPPTG